MEMLLQAQIRHDIQGNDQWDGGAQGCSYSSQDGMVTTMEDIEY